MDSFLPVALGLAWAAILAGCWLGWQLLRQNGRLLLRLEDLEKRFDTLEFGEEPRSEKSQIPNPESQNDESLLTSAATGNGDNRGARFSNHSVARSKIKRDGLRAGTPAPDFRLPRLDGPGELGLSDFRGRRLLLVFSSPNCGPCNALAPELEEFYRSQNGRRAVQNGERPLTPTLSPSDGERVTDRPSAEMPGGITVVMISKGEPRENREKVKQHGLTFAIVLQQQWEISRRYAIFATPIAYLIDEQGLIVEDVAVGTESIQKLISNLSCLQSDCRPGNG